MPRMKRGGIPALREAVRGRVSETSLRYVADDIGMSFSGLRSFLAGTDPHPATVKKLTAWMIRSRASAPPQARNSRRPNRAEFDAAVEYLGAELLSVTNQAARQRRLREIVSRIAEAGEMPID